ncbi:OmpA family protein [Agriterribacter sp.]|uniref:OmpA family protein n=1 Tax=Agriterribacter sp. TaxID=2821509 RepID=UPI002C900E99|nr:OmpA family protein [Agriterribacter sp.]HRO48328.1 OmpA family protein [Agriterribacter sp.]HRQ17192.1 OmpA family protein [Agriterribacter sp.]
MKTLLIITSIILLSFQIDRLLVTHFSGDSSKMEILSNALSIHEPGRDVQPAHYNAVAGSLETIALETAAVKATPDHIEKKPVVKLKTGNNNAAQSNSRNSALHHNIKQSGKYLGLNTVQFGFDQYEEIETKAFNQILQFADQLIFNESLKISIAGFTDNTGSAEYNKQLSLLRAQNIKQYMLDLGVNESQIIISANGVSYPVADNDRGEGRAANRRVEMLLVQL